MMSSKPVTIDLPEDLFSSGEATTEIEPKAGGMSQWAKTTRSGKPRTTKKPKTIAAGVFNRARSETQAMIDSGEWSECTPRHLVALYDLMHMQIYGVEALMSSTERHEAVLRMGSFVRRAFGTAIDCCDRRQTSHEAPKTLTCKTCGADVPTRANTDPAIDYFRWLWTREMGREKWRRENDRDGERLTIHACISSMRLTDYKLHLTRRRR